MAARPFRLSREYSLATVYVDGTALSKTMIEVADDREIDCVLISSHLERVCLLSSQSREERTGDDLSRTVLPPSRSDSPEPIRHYVSHIDFPNSDLYSISSLDIYTSSHAICILLSWSTLPIYHFLSAERVRTFFLAYYLPPLRFIRGFNKRCPTRTIK